MHHRCRRGKKTNSVKNCCTRLKLPRCRRQVFFRRTTGATNGNLHQRALHSPRQRAVTQHKRESRGKASGRHNEMSRACQLPLFCWVVFMSRALSPCCPRFITACRGQRLRTACAVDAVCSGGPFQRTAAIFYNAPSPKRGHGWRQRSHATLASGVTVIGGMEGDWKRGRGG